MFILIQPAGGKMSIFHSPYLIFNDPAETLSLNPDQLRGFESESLRLEVRSYEDVSSVISWSREMRQLRSPEIPTETLELVKTIETRKPVAFLNEVGDGVCVPK